MSAAGPASAQRGVAAVGVALAVGLVAVAGVAARARRRRGSGRRGDAKDALASRPAPTRFVCVYCGSSPGANPAYVAAARRLGTELARRGLGLVYGGGSAGVMGEVARAVDEAGGVVVSVIPTPLIKFCEPIIQPERLVEVHDMHTRKRIMIDRSSAFLALPGGVGTMEELLETATWLQLGLHSKRLGVLNVAGYWNALRDQFRVGLGEGFIKVEDGYCVFDEDVERLLTRLLALERQPSDVKGLTSWIV